MIVTLGRVIAGSKGPDVLGITDRAQIIDYVQRAVEIAAYKGNFNPWLKTLDVCSDSNGVVTLPSFVGTVLKVNVGGRPSWFRNSWYEFHINGLGNRGACGPACGILSTDELWSPVFQDLKEWSYLAAICEDPIDGDGTLQMIVRGQTMDSAYNQKSAITIPVVGPSSPGVVLTLRTGYAATDPQTTPFKSITQVTKPVTRGYVKLLAFPGRQLANAVTLGYYGPNETDPRYRRIRVNKSCEWVRVRFRMNDVPLTVDSDIVPLESYQATLDLLKAIRLRDSNDYDGAEKAETKAVQLLQEIQGIEDGGGLDPIEVDPSFGIGTIDYR